MSMKDSLNDIVYSIINTVRPQLKDDDWIEERDIKQWIHDQRNEFGKQQIDKNPLSINDNFLLTENVEMDVNYESFGPEGYFIISKEQIPSILYKVGSSPVIKYISSNHEGIGFQYTFKDMGGALSYMKGARNFNKFSTYSTIADNRLILLSKSNHIVSGIKNLKIRAFFENPEEVSTYNSDTDIYPLPKNLRPIVEKKIVQEKFGLNIQNYSDENNNASHELNSNIKDGI